MSRLVNNLTVALFLAASHGAFASGDPIELTKLESAFQSAPHERSQYILNLENLRQRYVTDHKYEDASAVDAEIMKHPLPKDADGVGLSKLRVGKWRSARHDLVYREDGTWSFLLPEDLTTVGKWRIEGNQYFDWVPSDNSGRQPSTIILLNADSFVYSDGKDVFYEKRLPD